MLKLDSREHSRLKADLAAAGLAPNKKLGQNFMVDQHAIEDLVAACQFTRASSRCRNWARNRAAYPSTLGSRASGVSR